MVQLHRIAVTCHCGLAASTLTVTVHFIVSKDQWRPSFLQFLSVFQNTSRCCRQSTHKTSEVLLPLWLCSEPYHPLLSCVKAKKSMLELHRQLPHSREGKPRVSVCSGNWELPSRFDSAGIDFWTPTMCSLPLDDHHPPPRGFQPISCLFGKSSV